MPECLMFRCDPRIERVAGTSYWFDYADFYRAVAQRPWTTYVELGCWKGHSTAYLAQAIASTGRIATVYAVDLFDDVLKTTDYPAGHPIRKLLESGVSMYDIFLYNIEKAGIKSMIQVIRKPSWKAARLFDEVDFVFVDAAHDEESVRKDIEAWLPKTRMIAGHDYGDQFPGVRAVVDDLLPERQVVGNVWAYEKV